MLWQEYTLKRDSEISVIGWNSSEGVVFNNFFFFKIPDITAELWNSSNLFKELENLPIKKWIVHETWEVGNSLWKIPTEV